MTCEQRRHHWVEGAVNHRRPVHGSFQQWRSLTKFAGHVQLIIHSMARLILGHRESSVPCQRRPNNLDGVIRGVTMSQDESRPLPGVVDRQMFDERLEVLREREKAHTREGDAIAAARRRLPMVAVAADNQLLGPHGHVTLLDAFEGRRQLIA